MNQSQILFTIAALCTLFISISFKFLPVPFSYHFYLSDEKFKTLSDHVTAHPPPGEIPRVPYDIDKKEFFEGYFLFGRPVIIGAPPDFKAKITTETLSGMKSTISGENFSCDVSRASHHRRILRDLYDPPLQFSPYYYSPPSCEMFYHTSGLPLHLDSNCGSTYVLQLQGEKRWKLYPPSTDRSGVWGFNDVYEGVLHPGEILIFHVGFWHETTSTTDDTIPLSLNMLIPTPLPIYYLREFYDDLSAQRYNEQAPTARCEWGWKLAIEWGFTPMGLKSIVKEFIWRRLDNLLPEVSMSTYV